MVKIAVLVSGGGTNLQALLDAPSLGAGEIALVLSSNPEAYALRRAQNAGVPTAVVSRKDFPDREGFTAAVVETLRGHDIELVVLSGFMYILGPLFCEAFRDKVLNVHPALIPAFCGDGFYGLRVHKAVLEAGVKLTGATVHFVSEVTDGGPIILQKAVAVEDGDTPETLQRRVMEQAEWIILPEAVRLFCDGRLRIAGNQVKIVPNTGERCKEELL